MHRYPLSLKQLKNVRNIRIRTRIKMNWCYSKITCYKWTILYSFFVKYWYTNLIIILCLYGRGCWASTHNARCGGLPLLYSTSPFILSIEEADELRLTMYEGVWGLPLLCPRSMEKTDERRRTSKREYGGLPPPCPKDIQYFIYIYFFNFLNWSLTNYLCALKTETIFDKNF